MLATAGLVEERSGTTFMRWMCSSTSTTSFMCGRFFGSGLIQESVMRPISAATLDEYWPMIPLSIICFTRCLFVSSGLNQSTKLSCPLGRFGSCALNPVITSSNTTPKAYTSLLTYKWPDKNKIKN